MIKFIDLEYVRSLFRASGACIDSDQIKMGFIHNDHYYVITAPCRWADYSEFPIWMSAFLIEPLDDGIGQGAYFDLTTEFEENSIEEVLNKFLESRNDQD